MTRILAIDPSLTATGVAFEHDGSVVVTHIAPATRGAFRLSWFREQFTDVYLPECDAVYIEGYAYAEAQRAHQLGELGGVIRLACFDADKPCIEVPPSTLKMYATGKGNAPKDLVLVEAVKRLGYVGASKDEADALWLYYLGYHHAHGEALVDVPAQHSRALTKMGDK